MPSTTTIEIPAGQTLTLREGRFVIIDGINFRIDRIQTHGRITLTPGRGVIFTTAPGALVAKKPNHAPAPLAGQPDPTDSSNGGSGSESASA